MRICMLYCLCVCVWESFCLIFFKLNPLQIHIITSQLMLRRNVSNRLTLSPRTRESTTANKILTRVIYTTRNFFLWSILHRTPSKTLKAYTKHKTSFVSRYISVAGVLEHNEHCHYEVMIKNIEEIFLFLKKKKPDPLVEKKRTKYSRIISG